jgi:cysteine desulfuration protein SufE
LSTPLPAKLQGMVNELAELDDLTDKYEALIDMGEAVPDIPADKKVAACMVHGCQSLVHVYADYENGKLRLHGFADALIVNGLLALLVLGLDGLTPKEFLSIDPKFIETTGVIKTLTASRVNGFYNIHEKLKLEALKYLAKEEGKA